MRALRIHDWAGPLSLESVPDPVPQAGEVLVKVAACSVGLTVLNMMRGDLGQDPGHLPRIPGHEIVGRVVAVGPGVGADRVGEFVAAYTYLFCGKCRRCIAGEESLCDNLAGFLGVDRDGGYAELCALPARNAVPLPEGLSPIAASVIPDALTTSVHVCRRSAIEPGDRVMVVGAGGGVGVHLVQVAQAFGAEVAGLDVETEKLNFLERELRVRAVDSRDFAKLGLPASWRGVADVVVDLVGNAKSLAFSLSRLDTGGRLTVLTTFRDVAIPVAPRDLVFRQASLVGSRYASRSEMLKAADLLGSERVRAVVTETASPEGVEAIHERLRQGTLIGRGALVFP